MGGGSSRLNVAEGEVVPVKIRPLLLRRFEELRKRRNGGTLQIEGTLSKKQLLKDGEELDSNSQSSHETEIETQNKEKEPANEDIMAVQVISIDKLSRVVPLPNSECCKCECKCKTEGEEEEEKDPNTEQNNQEKVFHVEEEKVFHVDKVTEVKEEKTRENEQEVDAYAKGDHDHHDHDHDNDNDHDHDCVVHDNDDDGESEEYGRLVCPGSPSFRIYCIEAERRKEEEEEEESKDQIIAIHKKSRSADSVASAASRNSRNSNELIQIVEIESTQKKKGYKIKKFGAVKTLLKVKSCYHPMSNCTGNDRNRLLVAKATN